jgi:soluble lytic murein transglycosylase-like protein
MRNRKQSKVSALLAACGPLLAGLLLFASPTHASNIVGVTQPDGRIVFVNVDRPARGSEAWGVTQASSARSAKIDSIVRRVATQYRIDPKLIRAIIQTESDYDPSAVSSKGAMGLMQLIPATAQRFGVGNPFDPSQNIEGGVSYLKYLLKLFGGNLPLSLAAYNAGENTVIKSGGIPAIPETEHYVRKVTRLYHDPASGHERAAVSSAGGAAAIYRYVDSAGVVHFTNVE